MTGDCHVRFRESLGVKFPRATRLNKKEILNCQRARRGSVGVPGLMLLNPLLQVDKVKVNPAAHPDNGETPGPNQFPDRRNGPSKEDRCLFHGQEPGFYLAFRLHLQAHFGQMAIKPLPPYTPPKNRLIEFRFHWLFLPLNVYSQTFCNGFFSPMLLCAFFRSGPCIFRKAAAGWTGGRRPPHTRNAF